MTISGIPSDQDRVLLLHQCPLPEQLSLKDRALAMAAEGITIADAGQPDMPLIYVNAGFERLTGYGASEVLGKNCRFLQGCDTGPEAAAEIRRSIREQRDCTVEILNYKKDGTRFWNRLSITPLRDDSGRVTHYIGIQSDVTARREAQDQLWLAKQDLEIAYGRIKADLEAAAGIQQALLPPRGFGMEGVRLHWLVNSCDELAGDGLNVIALDSEHLGFYMIDVSGHGVGAALLSVALSRVLSPLRDQSCLFQGRPDIPQEFEISRPAQVAEHLNGRFPMDPRTNQYFCFFYAIMNARTGSLTYVMAGHPPPIRLSGEGECSRLPGSGFPVGLFPNPRYEEHEISLSPGERLYLHTDGIVEATNTSGEEFGTARLERTIQQCAAMPLEESVDRIAAAVGEWCAPDRPHDDVSLLALEFSPPRNGAGRAVP